MTAPPASSLNDWALLRLQQTLKDALDPNGSRTGSWQPAGRYLAGRLEAMRHMKTILSSWAVAALLAAQAGAADEATIERGRAVFQYWCTPCHGAGPGYPGTQALAALYQGQRPAVLEERTDLVPAITEYYVRNGVSVMPPFRKTEISDEDLAALAAYLAPR